MYRCCLKLLQQKASYYISWNVLFLWGFGLWIALCTSNLYRSIISKGQDFEAVSRNISTGTQIIEEMLYIARTSRTFSNVMVTLKTVLQYIYAFVSISFVTFLAFRPHGSFAKVMRACNDTICNFCLTIFVKSEENNCYKDGSSKTNSAVLKLMPNSTSTKHVQTELSSRDNDDKWALTRKKNKNITSRTDTSIIQSEIIFTSRALLLYSNCELYRCIDDRRLKNHLLTKYLARVENNLETSNEYEKNGRILPKKFIKGGIISSSPEFKRFLANLKKSELFYPCMLEVSASYMIRIKSTCKSARLND